MSYKEYTVKVYANGTKSWYLNDKLHREDGPAVEYADGSKYWFLNGKLHREDGPAIEDANGSKEWYLNGEECTEAEFLKKTSRIEEVSSSETEEVIISMERLATFLHDEGWYTKEHIAIQAINKIKELNEKLTRNSS
jgi:hypothetical protein